MSSKKQLNAFELRGKLSALLSKREKQPYHATTERRAGVLLIFYPKNGSPHILFTKRSEEVAEHKGQISFPGGAADPEDRSLSKTALRETREELGIRADEFQILGELDDVYVPPTRFLITPFVAFLENPPRINPSHVEISEVFEAPISELMNPGIFREETRESEGTVRHLQFYSYKNYVIWGATARILKQFLDMVSAVSREAHQEEHD